jgi:hypothetical protein
MEVLVFYGMIYGLEEFQGLIFLNFFVLPKSLACLSQWLGVRQMYVACLISLLLGYLDLYLEQQLLLIFKSLQAFDGIELGPSSLQMDIEVLLST